MTFTQVQKELTIRVWGSNTSKGTYFNSVSVNGYNLIAPWGGPAKSSDRFEVVEVISGGYTHGDSGHAWSAEYVLRIRCVAGSPIRVTGRQLNGASGYEILSKSVVEE